MSAPRKYSPRKTLIGFLFIGGLVFFPYVRAHFLPRSIEFNGQTMGTTYTVKIADTRFPDSRLRALQQDIDALLEGVNDVMSTYRPESEISRFNQSTNTQFQNVSPELVTVTRFALKTARESGGALDPTVTPLVDLWGFYRKQDQAIPGADAIAKAREDVGPALIETADVSQLRKTRPGTSLDLSAVAKGYGVDQVLELLMANHCRDVYVNIGGEIRTHGHAPGDQHWRIAVETPHPDASIGEYLYLKLRLDDCAIASSGDYRNYFKSEGRAYSHIIDPRTGYPITNGVASVSVLAPDCMAADALATALMVMGPADGLRLIERLPDTEALLITRDSEGRFSDQRSSGLAAAIIP